MRNLPSSRINIPVFIHQQTIEASINKYLPEVLYEDNEASDDGLLLIAKKTGDLEIQISNDVIHSKLPFNVWVKKDTLLSDIELEASLVIDLKTNYSFPRFDQLQTSTELEHYEWVEAPKAKVAGMNLSVKSITDFIIKKSRDKLTDQIDHLLNEQFQIRTLIAQAWAYAEQPFPLYPPLDIWLIIQPQQAGLLPFEVLDGYIRSQLMLDTTIQVIAGAKPVVSDFVAEPKLVELKTNDDKISLCIQGVIPISTLEKAAKLQLIGHSFSFAGYDVSVTNINLGGDDQKIMVQLDLEGSYSGWARLTGKPKFDAIKQVLSFEDLEYELDGNNPLISGLGWLFRRTFERKLKEALSIKLDQPMQTLRKTAQQQLDDLSFHPSIKLQGNIQRISILSASYKAQEIHLEMEAKGKLRIVDQRSKLA